MQITSTDYSVVYSESGAITSNSVTGPSTYVARVTAEAQGYTTPHFRFRKDGGSWTSWGAGSTYDIDYASTSYSTTDTKDVIEVETRVNSVGGDSTAEDSISIIKVKAGKTANSTHEVTVYNQQTAASTATAVPTVPNNLVYNFSQRKITSGLTGNWTNNWPGTVNNKVIWASKASAQTDAEITSSTTDTLATSDWSSPVLLDRPKDINTAYRYSNSGTNRLLLTILLILTIMPTLVLLMAGKLFYFINLTDFL